MLENDKKTPPLDTEQLKLHIQDIIYKEYDHINKRLVTPPVQIALDALQ